MIVTDHTAFDYDAIVDGCDLVVDSRNAVKRRAPHVFRLGAPARGGCGARSRSRSRRWHRRGDGSRLLGGVRPRALRLRGVSARARGVGAGRGPCSGSRASDHLPPVSIVLAARNEAARLPGRIREPPGARLPRRPAGDHRRVRRVDRSRPRRRWRRTRARAVADRRSGSARAAHRDRAARQGGRAQRRRRRGTARHARVRRRAPAVRPRRACAAWSRTSPIPRSAAVSGELVLDCEAGASASSAGEGVGAYWRYEKWLRAHESAIDSMLGATGAIYAMRRACWRPLPEGTILDDVLAPMRAVLAGWRVVFEPRARAFDVTAPDVAAESRRKTRTLAGNYQMLALEPRLLVPGRNRVWLQYVSHKLGRLLVPWALLVAARREPGARVLLDALPRLGGHPAGVLRARGVRRVARASQQPASGGAGADAARRNGRPSMPDTPARRSRLRACAACTAATRVWSALGDPRDVAMNERLTFNAGVRECRTPRAATGRRRRRRRRDRVAAAQPASATRLRPVARSVDRRPRRRTGHGSACSGFTAVLFLRPQDQFPPLAMLHLAEVFAIVGLVGMIMARTGRACRPCPYTPEIGGLRAFGGAMLVGHPVLVLAGRLVQGLRRHLPQGVRHRRADDSRARSRGAHRSLHGADRPLLRLRRDTFAVRLHAGHPSGRRRPARRSGRRDSREPERPRAEHGRVPAVRRWRPRSSPALRPGACWPRYARPS